MIGEMQSMKLSDDLKKKLEAAQSKEEAEAILAEAKKAAEDAGVILDDAEMDQVAGGMGPAVLINDLIKI